MAIGATIYRFHVSVSDLDRRHFVELDLHVARHPSESELFLVVRALARCLEDVEGLEMSKGVSDTTLPALYATDLTGALTLWVEVGVPAAKRVHKATSQAAAVKVYAHKQHDSLITELRTLRRKERVTLLWFDDSLVLGAMSALSRNNQWTLTRSDGHIYLGANDVNCDGVLHQRAGAEDFQ